MTDEERMKDLLRRRATVYNTNRVLPMYYRDDDIDFLLALIDERGDSVQASIVAWLQKELDNESLTMTEARVYREIKEAIALGDYARPEPSEECE